MKFAEQLNTVKKAKIMDFADEFLGNIKPELVKSAENGHSNYNYIINTKIDSERENLQIYSDPFFVKQLNKVLDGVKVTYKREASYFLGILHYSHYLLFKW